MLTNFNRLSKTAAIVALTVGVVFAQPGQKASAQITRIDTISGAGASSVTDLLTSVTGSLGPQREL